jgi:hypothetical protein
MATQVARAILRRASVCGRLRDSYLEEVLEIERHNEARLQRLVSENQGVQRVAFFDMDGTLLNGRFVQELAQRTGRSEALASYLDNFNMGPNAAFLRKRPGRFRLWTALWTR